MNITIIYGTETGNSEGLANDAEAKLNELGHSAEVFDMADVTVDQLKDSEVVLVVTSTWGDGEAPSNAEDLHDALEESSEDLSDVKYAVFALGDSSFEHFCQAGKDFDEFLGKLGAQQILPVQLSDGDYDDTFPEWVESVAAKLA